jgi:hypothetical protein
MTYQFPVQTSFGGAEWHKGSSPDPVKTLEEIMMRCAPPGEGFAPLPHPCPETRVCAWYKSQGSAACRGCALGVTSTNVRTSEYVPDAPIGLAG